MKNDRKTKPCVFMDIDKKDDKYKIRCYKRNGDLDHEEFFNTLKEAEHRRTEWGLSIGLEPEPTYKDFAFYPTIWEWKERKYYDGNTDFGWERLYGY